MQINKGSHQFHLIFLEVDADEISYGGQLITITGSCFHKKFHRKFYKKFHRKLNRKFHRNNIINSIENSIENSIKN